MARSKGTEAVPRTRACHLCRVRHLPHVSPAAIAATAAICLPVALGTGFANAATPAPLADLHAAASAAHPQLARAQAATPACTDSWRGGRGPWTGGNWSAGTPDGNTPVVCITVPGSVVTISNDVQINALVVGGSSGAPVKVVVASTKTVESDLGTWKDSVINPTGVVEMTSAPSANSYTSTFSARNGATVTNDGRISTAGAEAFIGPDIVNNPAGTIVVDARLNQTNCCTVVNKGTIDLGPGATWDYEGTDFTQSGGTLDNLGTLEVHGGTFTMAGGRQAHHPVELTGFVTLVDGPSPAPGSFTLIGDNTVSGVIPSSQRLTLLSTAASESATSLGTPSVVNNGDVTLDVSAPGSSDYLEHSQLLNHGTLNVVAAGTGATLNSQVTNYKGSTTHFSGTGADVGNTFSNSGTVILGRGTDVQLNGVDFSENPGSTFAAEVGPHGATSELSALEASHVTLAGTLRVTTVGDPAAGATYRPISVAGSTVTGKFAHISSPQRGYSVSYGPTSVTLTAK